MKTWSVCALSNCGHRVDISGLRKQQHQDQLARIAVFLLVFTFCCPLHAQNDDYVSSNTNVITIDTKVVISAPLAVFTKSLDIFTTGIPIHPVYIQAPSGLSVWLSIRCKGGAARLSLPDYVANYSLTQTDPSGPWNPAVGTLNATDGTYLVTGLGIKFNQNISVSNDVLTTLAYGKGADNDIAGKATMTITVNWTITIPNRADTFQRLQSKRIVIWAPTSLTSISTFRATVAAICLLGIFIICCFCSLNTVAVSSLRRFSVTLARETRDQQECEQNRVFNPLWMPCAPTLADYNIESTPNPLMLMQRRKELKTKILRMRTPFSLMDRILRASHVKTSHYTCVRCRFPCAPASPPLRDSSSDDDKSDTLEAASKNRSGCCLRSPGSDDGTPSSEVDRDSTTPRDPQLLSAQPCDPPQVGSQPVAPSTAIPALTQANWRPSQQGATRDIEKYPAEPGVYLRDQYNRQDGGPQGNRGGSENITVGYAFVQHRLAPSQGVHVDPNLTCARNRFVFGAEDEILDPTLATKILDSVSDSEVEEEVVAESDLEFESEMRFEAASNLGDGSSLSFSRGLRVSESPPAERGSDSGRTSECFRSPLSDLYEDVLESCSPVSSRRSPWRSDASMYADPSALRMQQRS